MRGGQFSFVRTRSGSDAVEFGDAVVAPTLHEIHIQPFRLLTTTYDCSIIRQVAVLASGRRMAPWPGETIHMDAHRVAPGPGRRRLTERGGQRACRCRTALPERRAGCAGSFRNGCWRSWRPGD